MNFRQMEERKNKGKIFWSVRTRIDRDYCPNPSRPMRILYRKKRKTGPETLPIRWVEQILPELKYSKKVIGLDPTVYQFSVKNIDTRNPIDREKISKFIIVQYDLLIIKLEAWIKRYKQ